MDINIPGYTIREKLAEGSNFSIYKGYDDVIGDKKALLFKVVKRSRLIIADIDRIKLDYKLLQDVKSDGIENVYEIKELNGELVLKLEYINAVNLKKYLNNKPISLESFLQIAAQLAGALGDVHKRDIIHSSIRPQSILINQENNIVKLTNFGLLYLLTKERESIYNRNILETRLPYISPEQTGRMNRPMDFRTDFYSLGIIFHEMLTGKLPFNSTDPIEFIHYHIAKKAKEPIEINDKIPESVSNIVVKLMSKNAEDRYQNGYGLEHDLLECLDRMNKTGKIENFILGKKDRPKELLISQKIYGRDKEIDLLINIFERVSHGKREIILVKGDAGVGKSKLVHEIYKPIIRKNGYFISGKYDQFKRNEPYSAVVRAFQMLIKQLTIVDAKSIQYWKIRLLDALGSNTRIIIDVIPELELIVGKQPDVQKLAPIESQNRFHMAFKGFINVFAQEKHPLTIFLDDLQWIDSASLNLIETMLTDPDVRYLFFIGSYRDNEVTKTHPLSIKLAKIEKMGIEINNITLASLNTDNVNELIMDTMNCSEEVSRPLSEHVFNKTAGNPFFLQEFLKTIYDEDLIRFDIQTGWQCDIEKIKEMQISDNVIDLMTNKIIKLSQDTQEVLKLASCIGNRFDSTMLANLYNKPSEVMFNCLAETVREGFIIPAGYIYGFLHDRIQEAAYSLIPAKQKEKLHLKIGYLIQKHTKKEELSDKIFDIVDHLNVGRRFISDKQKKYELAEFNLVAGKKAKASSAYGPALKYVNTGMELLASDSWQTMYKLTFELSNEHAECQYLNGDFDASERIFDTVLKNARTYVEKADVYNKKLVLYTIQHKIEDAVKCGIKGLKLFGLNFPLKPSRLMTLIELLRAKLKRGLKKPEDLICLPEINEHDKNVTMNLLTDMMPVVFFTSRDLFSYIVLRMVNLSFKYGISAMSSYVFSSYGIILGSGLYDFKTGYKFGKLGIAVSEKYNDTHYKCQSNFIMGWFINHWTNHVKTSLNFLKKSHEAANESGNLIFAGYSLAAIVEIIATKGDALNKVLEESKKNLDIVKHTKDQINIYVLTAQRQWALSLKGLTKNQSSLSDDYFDEESFVAEMLRFKNKIPISWYYVLKLQTLYILTNYTEAHKIAVESERFLDHIFGFPLVAEHYFYYSLTLIATYPNVSKKEKAVFKKALAKNQRKMKKWANNCQENFLHKYMLVNAELARISGKDNKAMELYDDAIKSAVKNEYIQNAAIGNELAARFFITKGKKRRAGDYLIKARDNYNRWGANCKVKALEEQYPELFRKTKPGNITETLDLKTILKASSAISEEIFLDKLLVKLMRIVIENAGAQNGYLLLEKDGELYIEAASSIDKDEVMVLQSINLDSYELISNGIIHYVINNKESLVLNDAVNEGLFTNDKCVLKNKSRSILCMPIFKQLKLVGILYIENNLTANAFTPEKLEVLRLLSSQIAISLENAKFFDDTKKLNIKLNKEIVERKRIEEEEKRLIAAMESVGEAIVITDSSGNIQYCNPAFEKTFGYQQKEVAGQNIRILKSGKQNDAFYYDMWSRITKGKTWKGKIINRKKDGTLITEMQTISPIRNASGKIVNYVSVKRDITREIEFELRLQSSQKMEAIGTMAGGIAHDFNNMLTPIMVYTEVAKNSLPEDNKVGEMLDHVLEASNRAKELVQQILTFSRRDKVEFSPIEIEPVVKEALRLLRASIPITIDMHQNIVTNCGKILADPTQIHQIVINLCTNAAHAMHKEGGKLEVTLSEINIDSDLPAGEEVKKGKYVKLMISDTGCGMPHKVTQRIFDPFFTTKDKGKGTGMGLAVVHGIVKNYGGTITVSSELGKGTVFNIYFPKLKDETNPAAKMDDQIAPKGEGSILFVDDEEYIANLGQHMLNPLGYNVEQKTSSVEALETFLAQPDKFDIVITDMTMPKITGDKLARKIRAVKPDIPIILCTGFSENLNHDDLKEIGIFKVIKKPYNTYILGNAIWDALNKK